MRLSITKYLTSRSNSYNINQHKWAHTDDFPDRPAKFIAADCLGVEPPSDGDERLVDVATALFGGRALVVGGLVGVPVDGIYGYVPNTAVGLMADMLLYSAK